METLKQQLLTIRSDDLIFTFVALTFFLLPTGTAPPIISVSIAGLIWLFTGKISKINSIVKQSWFWPVIPFILLPWIGLLYSQNLTLGLDYAEKTQYWLIIFLTAGLELNEKRMSILLKCFWAGLLSGAVLAFLQFFGIIVFPVEEVQYGFGIVHTIVDMYLIVGVLTASFYFKKEKMMIKKVSLVALILAFSFHLAVLMGRSGYLVYCLMSPFFVNNLMNRFSIKVKILISIFIVGSLLLSPVARERLKTTIETFQNQKEKILKGEDIETLPRPFFYKAAIQEIIKHPFIGIGTGSLTEPTRAKGHEVTHPHNNFLYMGVSFGIGGILACFWLFWKMFKFSWGSRETALGYFIFSSCMVLFLGGLFDTQILNTGTLLFLSLSYGLLNHLCDNRQI